MLKISELAMLAVRGAIFSPDPFTAFRQIELTDLRRRPAKGRRRPRPGPDPYEIWLLQQYAESGDA